MPTFDFRLRFNLPETYRIDSDAEEFELIITPSGQKLSLRTGATGSAIKEHSRAVVCGGPFPSEREAQSAAEWSKRALLIWAVEQRAGIDFGDGRQRSIVTNEGLCMFQEQHGVPFRNDLHGIDVFEHMEQLRFVHVSASPKVGKYPPNVVDTFSREYGGNSPLTDKQVLACEIYASSFFDISHRSRFIALMTAVEALLEPAKRPGSVQELVKHLESVIKEAPVDDRTKASIRGCLQWLRYESISQSGRALADNLLHGKTYDGKSPDAFFAHCYDV